MYNEAGNLVGKLIYTDTDVTYKPLHNQDKGDNNPCGDGDRTHEHQESTADPATAVLHITADTSVSYPQALDNTTLQHEQNTEGATLDHQQDCATKPSPPLTPPEHTNSELTDSETAGPSGLTITPEPEDTVTYIHIATLDTDTSLTSPKLTTTLASNISQLLGTSQELEVFDELHHKQESQSSKRTFRNIRQLRDKHDTYMAKLTTNILKEKALTNSITDFEKDFYISKGQLPTAKHNPDYNKLVSSRKHARLLLRHLKINL